MNELRGDANEDEEVERRKRKLMGLSLPHSKPLENAYIVCECLSFFYSILFYQSLHPAVVCSNWLECVLKSFFFLHSLTQCKPNEREMKINLDGISLSFFPITMQGEDILEM